MAELENSALSDYKYLLISWNRCFIIINISMYYKVVIKCRSFFLYLLIQTKLTENIKKILDKFSPFIFIIIKTARTQSFEWNMILVYQ